MEEMDDVFPIQITEMAQEQNRDFLDICWKSQLAKIRVSDKFLTCLTDDFISQKTRTETAIIILTFSSKELVE